MSKKVFKEWNNPGLNAGYHDYLQNQIRQQWPALAQALDEMSDPSVRPVVVQEGNKAVFGQSDPEK